MNDQQEKKKTEAHDALIKHVFDNLRNVFICTTLLVAGGAIYRFRSQLEFGANVNVTLTVILIFTSLALLGWNMVHGVQKLILPFKKTRRKWLLLPLVVIYMLTVLTIFQAWALVQSELWRNQEKSQIPAQTPEAAMTVVK